MLASLFIIVGISTTSRIRVAIRFVFSYPIGEAIGSRDQCCRPSVLAAAITAIPVWRVSCRCKYIELRELGSGDECSNRKPKQAAREFECGLLLEARGETVAAEAAYRKAGQFGHHDAAWRLGVIRLRVGDTSAAEQWLRMADDNGSAGGSYDLGVLLEHSGDFRGARSAYGRADERGHAGGATNLGVLLSRSGDHRAAIEALRRGDAGGDANGTYCLGVLCEKTGACQAQSPITGARPARATSAPPGTSRCCCKTTATWPVRRLPSCAATSSAMLKAPSPSRALTDRTSLAPRQLCFGLTNGAAPTEPAFLPCSSKVAATCLVHRPPGSAHENGA